MTSKKYKLAQAKLGALFEQLHCIVWQALWSKLSGAKRSPNTFPRDMKLNQSE